MRVRIILCLFLSYGTIDHLYGQAGIKIGISNASFAISQENGGPYFGHEIDWLFRSTLPGIQLGFYKNFDITNHLGIQAEIFYAQRGVDASTRYLFDDIKYKIKLDYIEIPAELNVKLPLSKSVTPGLLVGPYLAMKLGAVRHSRIDGNWEHNKLENVHRFDYGLITGLYSTVVIWELHISLELRYNHGLSNIADPLENSVRLSDKYGKVRNRSFILLMGIQL